MNKEIEYLDIKKGDLVRFEYDDSTNTIQAAEYTAQYDEHKFAHSAGRYFLLRRGPELPQGQYALIEYPRFVPLIRDGNYWNFTSISAAAPVGRLTDEQVRDRFKDDTFTVLFEGRPRTEADEDEE